MSLDVSPSGELWRRTLSQIPSLFGRLVYLSSLRDTNSGLYQHFGFAQRFSEREAERTLRRSHVDTFADWLCLSLEEQLADLEIYFAGLDQDRSNIVSNWNSLPPFQGFIPAAAREAQRTLFITDAMLLLEVISGSR